MIYQVFGLTIRVPEELPGLILSPDSIKIDITLELLGSNRDSLPGGARELLRFSPFVDENNDPTIRLWKIAGGAYYRLEIADRFTYIVDDAGEHIWATWLPHLDVFEMYNALFGVVMGFVLRLRGLVCLHASAVSFNNKAVAFVGQAGAGKSTTALVLGSKGHPIISDDIVVPVNSGNEFLVQPGAPVLKLWSHFIHKVHGQADNYPLVVPAFPSYDKRFFNLDQNGYLFQDTPIPLGGIYLLKPDDTHIGMPVITHLPTRQSLVELVSNTYVNYLLSKEMRAIEFDLLSRIVDHLPVRSVIYNRSSLQDLSVHEVIHADLNSLVQGSTL